MPAQQQQSKQKGGEQQPQQQSEPQQQQDQDQQAPNDNDSAVRKLSFWPILSFLFLMLSVWTRSINARG